MTLKPPVFMERLQRTVEPHRLAVLNHPLYRALDNIEDVQAFMRHHIYAVWDFMSLLKELQRRFTDTSRIWHPKPNARLCRLINQIVLAEESDQMEDGRIISHYDLYVEAMKQAGAWNSEFADFYDYSGISHQLDVAQLAMNPHAEQFLKATFRVIDHGKDHEVAAYFFIGREALVPDMFLQVIQRIESARDRLNLLIIYLQRHIEIDGGEHGPMAAQMLEELCAGDETKWGEAAQSAVTALRVRKILWDGALGSIREPGVIR